MISLEGVGVALSALATVLVALGSWSSQRQKRVRLNDKLLEKDLTRRTTQYQVGMRHIGRLEDRLASAGIEAPRRPKELAPDWGEDEVQDDPGSGPVATIGRTT